MVEQTINSVATADYPADRLEIFAVDDGSKDDTWKYIQAAALRYPNLVTSVRFPQNRGNVRPRSRISAARVKSRLPSIRTA